MNNDIHSHNLAATIANALDGKRSGNGWTAHCPAHNDQNTPNLRMDEGDDGNVLVHCFAGCSQDSVIKALQNLGLWHQVGVSLPKSLQRCNTSKGLTLEEYAQSKKLDVDCLKSLDVSETACLGKPAIQIPYKDGQGDTQAVRIRREMHKRNGADQRFVWRKGDKPCLYGLWRLDHGTDSDYLVEGESDCHTLWSHGVNALGIPGAPNWREDRDAHHFNAFERIYVVIEPDAGGDAVLKWMEQSEIRDRAYLVKVKGGDISALHCEGPQEFKARVEEAINKAETWSEYHAKTKEKAAAVAWETCRELAESNDILAHFEKDLIRIGVVGVSKIGKILYLAFVSRFLSRPVSVAIKGTSSSGKSYIVEQTLKFFPQEAYYARSAMSERALVYSDEPLQHRFMVIYEATGLEGDIASYLIRSLLSEGRFVL